MPTADLAAVRSVLFLPASNPRAIARARASQADLVVLDLEDAVRPADKEGARDAAVAAMADPWPMPVAIRVNGEGTQWHQADLQALAGSRADFAVVPRTASAEVVVQAGMAVQRPVLAMIETAEGVLAAQAIAGEAAALVAGTNDLAADLQLPPGAGRQPMHAALQLVVLAARARGIPVFDGVFNHLSDPDGFFREAEEGRRFGFTGKSLIHPDQIDPCNLCFSPSADEVARAQQLLDAFDGGAQRFGDEMIERMHVDAARRLLARAHRSLPG
jgi:citrate lyase beta subunit